MKMTTENKAAIWDEYQTALANFKRAPSPETTADGVASAMAWADTIPDAQTRRGFVDGIQTLTGISHDQLETLKTDCYRHLEYVARVERRDRTHELIERMTELADAEDHAGALALAAAVKVNAPPLHAEIKPYTWDEFLHETANTGEGLRTGYPHLDELITIPAEALTLIGARTGHGKTALLVNLCRNMIDEYPDTPFAFLSYEQTRRQVLNRFLQRESGAILSDPRQNATQIHYYLKSANTDNEDLERGKLALKELTDTGRLHIYDKPYQADKLPNVIAKLKNKFNVGAVFLDYLQQIPTGHHSTRQAAVQAISAMLKDTAKKLHVPIIAACQLNRDAAGKEHPTLEMFREADDPVFDANTVLALVNPAMQDEGANEYTAGEVVTLELRILKNRDGAPGGRAQLDYDPPRQQITETEITGSGGIEEK